MHADTALVAACCYDGGATAVHGTDKLAHMHICQCPAPITGMHSEATRFPHKQKGIQDSGATERRCGCNRRCHLAICTNTLLLAGLQSVMPFGQQPTCTSHLPGMQTLVPNPADFSCLLFAGMHNMATRFLDKYEGNQERQEALWTPPALDALLFTLTYDASVLVRRAAVDAASAVMVKESCCLSMYPSFSNFKPVPHDLSLPGFWGCPECQVFLMYRDLSRWLHYSLPTFYGILKKHLLALGAA